METQRAHRGQKTQTMGGGESDYDDNDELTIHFNSGGRFGVLPLRQITPAEEDWLASLNRIGQFRNWKGSYIMDESCDGRLHFECILEDSVIRPDKIFDVSKYIDFQISFKI